MYSNNRYVKLVETRNIIEFVRFSMNSFVHTWMRRCIDGGLLSRISRTGDERYIVSSRIMDGSGV